MTACGIDIESFSTVDINRGLDNYKEGAELLCLSWKYADNPVQIWDATKDPMPAELEWILADDDCDLVAHHANFEKVMLAHLLPHIKIDPARWRCSMIRAFAHGLPGALGVLGEVFKLPEGEAKDKTGRQLINLFCKPAPKTYKIARATRLTHPKEWQWFLDYCSTDTTSMIIIWNKLPAWNYPNAQTEFDLWHLDQVINGRGMLIDTQLCEAAMNAVAEKQGALASEVQELTDGAIQAATQRDALLRYILAEYGVDLPDMQAATLERRMTDPELPEGVRELLSIRLQASTSSTSKYKKLLQCVSADGRLRNALQFSGAQRTARWSGRGPQMHNPPRVDVGAVAEWSGIEAKVSKYAGLLSYPLLKDTHIHSYLETGIEALKAGCADMVVDDVMALASTAVRGAVIAPPGKKLVIADLSNIEGRVCAWLAGEEWKLQAFRDFDAGTGPDLYKLSYARAFAVDPSEVDKPRRQIGKVMELMLQFFGGVGAFITGAATYGIDLDEMAENAWSELPEDVLEEAAKFWEWALPHEERYQKNGVWFTRITPDKTYGLKRQTFMACDSMKRLWRRRHLMICTLAERVGALTRAAIQNPDKVFRYRQLAFQRVGAWLRIRLPSGRYLCYVHPKLSFGEKDEPESRRPISYQGVNPYSRRWGSIHTYEGKIVENCLGADTLVLTAYGYKRIVDVTSVDNVWDGCEWAACDGVVCSGQQTTIGFAGVRITPEHRVLINGQWVEAINADPEKATSSFRRHHRVSQRQAGSSGVRWVGRSILDVACALRLRSKNYTAGRGVAERTAEVLRLFKTSEHRSSQHHTWNVEAPGVLGVAQHARPLSVTNTPSVAQLRRPRYQGLQTMGRFLRAFLGGYGRDLRAWLDVGAPQKFAGLYQEQLLLGDVHGPGKQPPWKLPYRHSAGKNASRGSVRDQRHRSEHVEVSSRTRMGSDRHVQTAGYLEPVYDILNAGPRQRFTILTNAGPVIVHNCTQAVARDVLAHSMPLAEARGYPIVLHVHDELVCETPDLEQYSVTELSNIMATNPSWAPNLPLAAGGFETYRYKKAD